MKQGLTKRAKKRLGKLGSRWAFEFFIETKRDQIVKGLRKYLAGIQPDDIPEIVRKGRFPPLEKVDFTAVSDNAEHFEKISLVRLMKFVAEARPDLAAAIQDRGMPGAKYIAKLRLHLIELVKQPEKALGKSTEYEPKGKMKLATCDNCHKSWPVPEAEVASIKECPFCGHKQGEEVEPVAE
ncbi:hypothetical protein ES705_15623 [subsurface metagenome]|jgi:hypothetical protein